MGGAAMLEEVATRTPGIVHLLPDLLSVTVPVWLVTHRELHTSRRIGWSMKSLPGNSRR